MKRPVLVAEPDGVVMVITPVAPVSTVAVIEVSLTTVKDAAAVPPKATAVAPLKSAPVIVTNVPVLPLVGENEVMLSVDGGAALPMA